MLCQVCEKLEKKYRCPTCKINYCSVPCFSSHKASCSPVQATHTLDTNSSQETVYQFQTKNTIPVDKLQELGKSDKLQQLLQNPHLRKFLTRIDSDDNPVRLMRSAMQEPIFLEFVDSCLDIVDPGREKELTDEQVMEAVSSSMRDED